MSSLISKPEHKLQFDIVIIGSGAGGGTVAKELSDLCLQGYKIALLELGPQHIAKDNNREELAMAQRYYFSGGGFQTTTQDMTLAFAKGVGGSTNVYTGVTFKLPESAVKKWNVPGITLDDLNPRMDKYLQENGAHYENENNINQNNKLFKKGCEKLGWHVDQFAINTRNCAGLGTCNLGCPIEAKQGTAVVQIPKAEHNGVQVIPNCRVDRIDGNDILAAISTPYSSQHSSQQSSVQSETNSPKDQAPWSYRIRAKKIILCAGAINTPAILLRSFGTEFNPFIGRYLTCHPAMIMAAEHPEKVDGTQGPPKNYYCEQFVESERFLLESCMYFPFSFSRNLVGFGSQVDEFVNRYPYLQMCIALVMDDAHSENRVSLNKHGEAQVHYKLNQKIQNSLIKATRANAKLMFAAGASRLHAPGAKQFFIHKHEVDQLDTLIHEKHFKLGQVSIASAHLMGGCKMGDSATHSVTNSWGKVHSQEHLYIADGSLFPSCSEVNPYLTIMALADRVAEGVKKDLKLKGALTEPLTGTVA